MKRGTKIGWILVAFSIVLSVTVIVATSSKAGQVGDFIISDDGTTIIEYVGSGGTVTLPDDPSITSCEAVFKNNTSITSITIPSNITNISADFASGCDQLQSVSLGNISSIPANAFRECESLVSVDIPGSVGSIGSGAFYGCSTLSSVSIPSGCTSIAGDAFNGCDNLSEISVASGNSNYSSSDGCLYNASKTRLIFVPEGKSSVSIPDSCTTIGAGAFKNCVSITSLTVPDSVTTIESGAFSGSSILSITIPETTTSIGSQSGWSPNMIYGYADSAAEIFAKNNSIPFTVIGPAPGPDPTPTPDPDPTPSPTPTPDQPGDIVNPDGSITHADGTTTKTDGTIVDAQGRVIKAGTGATGTSHTKDATPTTADGINPVYFLCIAIFLGGVAFIVYGRLRKTRIVKSKK